MQVIFDVQHLYYLPQYLPVFETLKHRDIQCHFIFYRSDIKELNQVGEKIIAQNKLSSCWVNHISEALEYFESKKAEWIIFGNSVEKLQLIHRWSKSALMQHGIGPKSCYYNVSNNKTSVRFVEGQHRLKKLSKLYPDHNFVDSGYAKLDPIFNQDTFRHSMQSLGLDPTKKTILYAPTYYPSSLERFSSQFAEQFSEYNIIIKAHHFSQTKPKYKAQQKLLRTWNKSKNVYLASLNDYNLIEFMGLADVLISDASSAIFEFAALNKPVIWCNFYKLRWSYRGFLKFRLKARLDSDIKYFEKIAYRVDQYKDLKMVIVRALRYPNEKSKHRQAITLQLAGKTDGECSVRICNYLESNA